MIHGIKGQAADLCGVVKFLNEKLKTQILNRVISYWYRLGRKLSNRNKRGD